MAKTKAKTETIGTGDKLMPATILAAFRARHEETGEPLYACLNAAEGLYCLVNRKGAKNPSWVYRYPYPGRPGKTREFGLGTLVISGAEMSGVTLSTARDLARDCRDKLAKGIDPAEERKTEEKQREDEAEDARRVALNLPARDSFRQFAQEYREKKAAGDLKGAGEDDEAGARRKRKTARWGRNSILDFEQAMRNVLGGMNAEGEPVPVLNAEGVDIGIGNMNVRTITTEHCYQVLAVIEARGALALMERVRSFMHRIFEMIRKRRIIEENPVAFLDEDTLSEHIGGNHPAVSTAQELRDVLLKFDAHAATETQQRNASSRGMSRAVSLQVLLFQRPHMIVGLRKEWIDWTGERAGLDSDDQGGVTIYYPFREMKLKPTDLAKRPEFHEIPVSRQAAEILRAQLADSGDSPYMFPGHRNPNVGMWPNVLNDNMQLAMGRVKKQQREWTPYQDAHGFRAVALTLGNAYLGLDKNVINSLQAHAAGDAALGTAYDRSTYVHLRRDAMQRYADWIDAVRVGKRYAMTLPKSALTQETQNRIDAEELRELRASGELDEFRAWKAAQAGASVGAAIIRLDDAPAANARQAA